MFRAGVLVLLCSACAEPLPHVAARDGAPRWIADDSIAPVLTEDLPRFDAAWYALARAIAP